MRMVDEWSIYRGRRYAMLMPAALNFGLRMCTGELRPLASHVQPSDRASGAGMFITLCAVKTLHRVFCKELDSL
jgi:hypothetical protein